MPGAGTGPRPGGWETLLYIILIYPSVYKERVSALANICDRYFRVQAHYVFINCTLPLYWTLFQTFTKAVVEMVAFQFRISWKFGFSGISGKLALFNL